MSEVSGVPPEFCQYAAGACDQDFSNQPEMEAVFLFPNQPDTIAATISHAVGKLRERDSTRKYRTWRDFQTAGQVIFCSICKSMRFSRVVVADVTTLNFNLLFEIGFALGLELPVIPVRDCTYERDLRLFENLGLLDTIGYLDFQNSETLSAHLLERLPSATAIPAPSVSVNEQAPLYVLKGPIETDAILRLMSTLRKSDLHSRTHDPVETPRLSLHDARRQVAASLGVVGHLLDKERKGATVHNAQCALVAGIAMATGKAVLLIQEGYARQPIDYRDVVASYSRIEQIPGLLDPLFRQVIAFFQTKRTRARKLPANVLASLDLGDVAAENEVYSLQDYFVRTAQFHEARRGHARIVLGRKGSGKSAIFFGVRDSLPSTPSHLVLDLMPEGHQFKKLRESVLRHLSPGLQEHTLVAFWNYLLLCEMAKRIGDNDHFWAQQDEARRLAFDEVVQVYGEQVDVEEGDFSERLSLLVDRVAGRFLGASAEARGGQLTELLFRNEIHDLDVSMAGYLQHKQDVWVLVDNLDKGWPARAAALEDLLIIRSLLEATRKLQRQLQSKGVNFHLLVFVRNDIYDLLVSETPDRGKDTTIAIDWDDEEAFREIVRERVMASTQLRGSFGEIWDSLCDSHVGTRDSFSYVVERTMMRPRDVLNFLHRIVEVAVNRGDARITSDDILKAEERYSNDLLQESSLEIRDVYPHIHDPLYVFLGSPIVLSRPDALARLSEAGFDETEQESALELLLWFGFLGVQDESQDHPRFAYQVRYNVAKLLAPINLGRGMFVIHPAFYRSLECT